MGAAAEATLKQVRALNTELSARAKANPRRFFIKRPPPIAGGGVRRDSQKFLIAKKFLLFCMCCKALASACAPQRVPLG